MMHFPASIESTPGLTACKFSCTDLRLLPITSSIAAEKHSLRHTCELLRIPCGLPLQLVAVTQEFPFPMRKSCSLLQLGILEPGWFLLPLFVTLFGPLPLNSKSFKPIGVGSAALPGPIVLFDKGLQLGLFAGQGVWDFPLRI